MDIIEKINKLCENGTWEGGAEDKYIDAIETVLNVTLSEDYKIFIKKFGSGVKNGVEIAGYHKNVYADENIIGNTILKKRDYYHFMNTSFLFLSDTGDGGYICMDLANNNCIKEIYRDNSKKGFSEKVIANSFLEYLELKFNV